MQRTLYGIVDAAKSFIIGIIAGTIIEIVSALIGLIIYKGYWIGAIMAGRNAVIFVGALGLLITAGLFLKKNTLRPLKAQKSWEKSFKVLNFGYTILILFIGIIIVGCIMDSIICKIIFIK